MGIVEPGKQVANAGAQPGDALVLTKPIGTGIITTGCKQGKSPPEVLAQAVQTMATLNRAASEAMMKVGVNACTDVTGFGLLGHLRSMVRGSGVSAKVRFGQVPILPGTWELLEQEVVPGGTYRNLQSVDDSVQWHQDLTEQQRVLLCDAQTSGGLLISVAGEKLASLLSELEAAGVATRSVVGEITQGQPGKIQVTP